MVIVDKTPLGPVHVTTTVTLVSTLPDSVAVQVRVTLWLTKRIPLGSRLVLRDGDSTNQEKTQTKLIVERNNVYILTHFVQWCFWWYIVLMKLHLHLTDRCTVLHGRAHSDPTAVDDHSVVGVYPLYNWWDAHIHSTGQFEGVPWYCCPRLRDGHSVFNIWEDWKVWHHQNPIQLVIVWR